MANIFEPEWEHAFEPFRVRIASVGRDAGGRDLGASVFEVAAGGRTSPFHVHHANEEMLFVLQGRPTLRTPSGERELATGETVSFPAGPEGAHQVLNRSDEPVRVLIVSTMRMPDVVEHLDSGKLLAFTGSPHPGQGQVAAFRRGDSVEPMTDETD